MKYEYFTRIGRSKQQNVFHKEQKSYIETMLSIAKPFKRPIKKPRNIPTLILCNTFDYFL